jgi:hypothetical protein
MDDNSNSGEHDEKPAGPAASKDTNLMEALYYLAWAMGLMEFANAMFAAAAETLQEDLEKCDDAQLKRRSDISMALTKVRQGLRTTLVSATQVNGAPLSIAAGVLYYLIAYIDPYAPPLKEFLYAATTIKPWNKGMSPEEFVKQFRQGVQLFAVPAVPASAKLN